MITCRRATVRPPGSALLVLLMLLAPTRGHPQSTASKPQPSPWKLEFDRARQLAGDGSLREAERIFDSGVRAIPDASPLRAYAYFGRAFVAQQRLVAGDTAGLPATLEVILADYVRAEVLDATGIGIAAHNNAGTLLRGLGRHEEARREFLAAASSGPHPDRATFYLNVALEFQRISSTSGRDSAGWSFREALKLEPARPDILRAYSTWLARVVPIRALLDSLTPWQSDTLRAETAANVLASLLVRTEPGVTTADAAAVLVALATSLPVMQVSPARFTLVFRDSLERAAVVHPAIAPGARSLIEALSPASGTRAVITPENAAWWRMRGRDSAWSSVLRWMGDWYFQQNRQPLAQQFYEAALGGDATSLNSRGIDRRALVPLAMIYLERDDRTSSARLQNSVDQFTRSLFTAKGDAYARGDLEQIRDFHLALATVYVAKGKWTGPGAESAEFQIEHLRQASRDLESRTGKPADTPPDLLAKLALHYQQSGDTAAASQVKADLRSQLLRKGKSVRADVLVRQINEDALKPDALKPAQKVMTTYDPKSAGSVAKPASSLLAPLAPTTRITGRVLTAQGKAIAGVVVELTADGRTYRAVAGQDGVVGFVFPQGSGDIAVHVAHPGYRDFTVNQKVSDSLQIRLTPLSSKMLQQYQKPPAS